MRDFSTVIMGSAVVLLLFASFTWSAKRGAEDAIQHYPKSLTYEEVRQAAWEANRPCDGKVQWSEVGESYPDAAWCQNRIEANRRKDAESEKYRLRDLMRTCAQETDPHYFEDETNHIDTVEHPRFHYSWVLGGDCESMAHDVKRVFGLCNSYVDDDPVSAEFCRLEVAAYTQALCAKPGLPDAERRECLYRSF